MTLDEIEKYFGSLTAAATKLGLKRQSTTYWKKIGCMPLTQQIRIELLSKGKLKADMAIYDKQRISRIQKT